MRYVKVRQVLYSVKVKHLACSILNTFSIDGLDFIVHGRMPLSNLFVYIISWRSVRELCAAFVGGAARVRPLLRGHDLLGQEGRIYFSPSFLSLFLSLFRWWKKPTFLSFTWLCTY